MSLFDDAELGSPPDPTFSVGELSDAIGNALRAAFRQEVWVRGEIHDLSRPQSGHVYLTLVEERDDGSRASLPVMLSAANKVSVNRSLTRAGGAVRMVDGTEVRVRGRLDWYGPRGQLQLRMTAIDPAHTLGQLELARAELLATLKAEGLFDRNRGCQLSEVPLRVGLVTSRSSAAEADFLQELTTSGFAFHVIAVDVRVQGPGAAVSIARGVASAAARGCDVIALVRGGGARTDLAAFDHEMVARAIAAAPVPVFTGVGHEIDRSVADELAHTTAKTPTACAQTLIGRVAAHLGKVEDTWAVISRLAQRDLGRHDELVRGHAGRAQRSANSSLDRLTGRLDDKSSRIERGAASAIYRAGSRLDRHSARMTGTARLRLRDAQLSLDRTQQRLGVRGPRALAEADQRVGAAAARVRALDPERALARGWSITSTEAGRLVRSPDDVRDGDTLITRLAGGEVRSTVVDDG